MSKCVYANYKESETLSSSKKSEMFDELMNKNEYKSNFTNINNRKRKLSSATDSDSEKDIVECILNVQEDNPRQFSWKKINLNPKIYNFDENLSGVKANINDKSSIVDIFQLFFSESVINCLVEITNNYYVSKYLPNNKHSRSAWKNTTVNEMYRFLAISMLMTRVKKLSLHEYWSTDKLIQTESFKNIMKRDRYLLLLKLIHFHDNDEVMNDPFIKIHNIATKLTDSFAKSFYPSQHLCVGENLILFKEQRFLKQFIPSKRSKFELKFYILCDCKTGYILDFIVHSGSPTDIIDNENSVEMGKSGNLVLTLLQPYLHRGHTLVTDNWCTSPSLYLFLHKNETNAFGTVRKNKRGMPLMSNKLCKGEFTFRSTDRLLALKWMDKREVLMLSTCHSAGSVETKKKHCRTGRPIMKPSVVADYNSIMSAIDKADIHLHSVNSIRKTLKWYKKIFFHMLDLSIYNAYVLYKTVINENLTFAKFHILLIREILEKYPAGGTFNAGGRTMSEDNPFRLVARHFPSKCVNPTAKRRNALRKCVVCAKHKKRRQTRFQCMDCNVGLCIEPCFELYHTIKNY